VLSHRVTGLAHTDIGADTGVSLVQFHPPGILQRRQVHDLLEFLWKAELLIFTSPASSTADLPRSSLCRSALTGANRLFNEDVVTDKKGCNTTGRCALRSGMQQRSSGVRSITDSPHPKLTTTTQRKTEEAALSAPPLRHRAGFGLVIGVFNICFFGCRSRISTDFHALFPLRPLRPSRAWT